MNNPRKKTRRRRSGGGGGGGGGGRPPRGPVMTPLGESTYEAIFDHGNQGYGVWFDGVVREDPMYRQNWKNNRPIYVKIEQDRILITKDKPGETDEDAEPEVEAGNSVSDDEDAATDSAATEEEE